LFHDIGVVVDIHDVHQRRQTASCQHLSCSISAYNSVGRWIGLLRLCDFGTWRRWCEGHLLLV
jgi:hypothetical protein